MAHKVFAIGGWAVPNSVFNSYLDSQTIHIDINLYMPKLITQGTLINNWKEVLRDLVLLGEVDHDSATLIGWSTGAIASLAIAPLFKNIIKLILISATPSFCRRDCFRSGVHPSILKKMINALNDNPKPVLQQFYKDCGFFEDSSFYEIYSKEELICGLQFLEQVSLFPIQKLSIPVICIHGTDDKIVPVEAGKFLCRNLGGEWMEFKGPHAFFSNEYKYIKELNNILSPERSDLNVNFR